MKASVRFKEYVLSKYCGHERVNSRVTLSRHNCRQRILRHLPHAANSAKRIIVAPIILGQGGCLCVVIEFDSFVKILITQGYLDAHGWASGNMPIFQFRAGLKAQTSAQCSSGNQPPRKMSSAVDFLAVLHDADYLVLLCVPSWALFDSLLNILAAVYQLSANRYTVPRIP